MGANFSSEPVVEKHTERDQNDTFTAAVSSCQGWRLSQEDEHSLILDLPGEHKASFFAVFDGHGSGRVSKHASVGLWRHLTENDKYIKGNYKEALEESFLSFDREVNESYNAQLAGTTAICVLVVDNVIYCANVGDSRAVASINCECVPLSQDHKPENPLELKRILAAGGYVFGNRVNGNLALSRAFGDFHYKSNDQLPADQQIVSPQPDIKRIELNDDVDFIVLACDGIWDVMTSKDVVKFVISRLEQNIEPGLICEQLTTRCIATDYELVIGCDNMTVLLVCHTRGRSWTDYCTDIFNKHTKLLGVPRTRTFEDNPDFSQQENRFLGSNSASTFDQDVAGRSVIDFMRDAHDNGIISSQEDEAPIITEIVADETPTSAEDSQVDEQRSDDGTSTEADSSTNQQTKTTDTDQTQTTTEQSDDDNQDRNNSTTTEDESNAAMSSGTTEIHLAAPDDSDDLTMDPKADSQTPSDEVNEEKGQSGDDDPAGQVQNIIEIELGSPDDDEDPTDGQANNEINVEDSVSSTQDELPEVVKDPETEESPADEATGSDLQSDDTNDESTDNQNES